MDLGTFAPSNSIENIKDDTLLLVNYDAYEPMVSAGESSHVRLPKPHGDPPAIAIKPNVAYGMMNIESSLAGSYVVHQLVYDSVRL